jgi:epoxyqueuosine reductase QueG
MDPLELAAFITEVILYEVAGAGTTTSYRQPLVSFIDAGDSRFSELQIVASESHFTPQNLLPGARAVVSFFLPFSHQVVEANSLNKKNVALEWAVAYVETNALIESINQKLIELLDERGVRGAAEPPTKNFDPVTLESHWSHKSVAVIAGLGSFGLHQMVITDSGCAGRFGSLVIDVDLPVAKSSVKERCLYYFDRSCLDCVVNCPVNAIDEDAGLNKGRCWQHLQNVTKEYEHLGDVEVCGKCAIGLCAVESAV